MENGKDISSEVSDVEEEEDFSNEQVDAAYDFAFGEKSGAAGVKPEEADGDVEAPKDEASARSKADTKYANVQIALRQERQAAREARERAAKIEETFQRLVERMGGGSGAGETEPKAEVDALGLPILPGLPDTNNPIEMIEALRQREAVREQRERWLYGTIAERAEKRQQDTQRAEAVAVVNQHGVAQFDEYVATRPEAQEALTALSTSIVMEMREQGYAEAQIVSALEERWLSAVATAAQSGRNVGEVITGMAKARGWAASAAGRPNAAAGSVARAESRANMQRGLTGKGKSSGSGSMSLETIANLDGADFDKAVQDLLKRR